MTERVSDFRGQSFHKLRRACLRRGALFKDPEFPTTAQALFYKRAPPPGVTWKRPRVRTGPIGSSAGLGQVHWTLRISASGDLQGPASVC
uniref:Calpain catalytic domain-containing protein n=1 Tax=Hippocampus comes TaxID=109280 RepID=A0A3Q2YK93_HIPCM